MLRGSILIKLALPFLIAFLLLLPEKAVAQPGPAYLQITFQDEKGKLINSNQTIIIDESLQVYREEKFTDWAPAGTESGWRGAYIFYQNRVVKLIYNLPSSKCGSYEIKFTLAQSGTYRIDLTKIPDCHNRDEQWSLISSEVELNKSGNKRNRMLDSLLGYYMSAKQIEAFQDKNKKRKDKNERSTTRKILPPSNYLHAIKLFLADLHSKDKDNNTLLIKAAGYGAADVVQLLIDNGADINAVNENGEDALYFAFCGNVPALQSYKILNMSSYHKDVIELLLTKGAVLRPRYGDKYTTLMALINNKFPIIWIKQLMKQQIDINERDPGQRTALFYAIYAKNPELVKLLLEAGADVNVKDVHGYSALLTAEINHNVEIINLIKAAGGK